MRKVRRALHSSQEAHQHAPPDLQSSYGRLDSFHGHIPKITKLSDAVLPAGLACQVDVFDVNC